MPVDKEVLGFQFMQPLGLGTFHAAKLGLPAIHRVLGHAVATRQVLGRGAGLVLLEDRNYLLFRILLALLWGPPLGSRYKEIPHPAWLELREYGKSSEGPQTAAFPALLGQSEYPRPIDVRAGRVCSRPPFGYPPKP